MLLPLNVNAQIQSTAYYRTKNSTSDNFLKVFRKKRLYYKFKNSKKNLCKTVPFRLTLKVCSPQFLPSAKTDSKKNVSFEYSQIVRGLPGKGLQ